MKSLCDNSISREKYWYDDEGWKDDKDDRVEAAGTKTVWVWLIFIFLTSVWRFFFLVKLTCHKVVITFWRVFWRNQTLCSVSTRNSSRCVNVFTRKIILISYTSVSALISLRTPSKTNDLKCFYEKGNLIHRGLRVKETYLSKCVM